MTPEKLKDQIENYQNFEPVLNSIEEDIAIISQDFRVLFENNTCQQKHGNNIGEFCYESYAKQNSVCNNCPSSTVFKTGKKAKSEHQSFDKNGQEHFVEIVSSPLKNRNGDIIASLEVVRDLTKKKREAEEKEKLICELETALSEIKTLRGILPICCFCKKVRDDQGYWTQVEEYVTENSNASFSHSYCPDCFKKNYPEFAKE